MKLIDITPLVLTQDQLQNIAGHDSPEVLAEAAQISWEHCISCMGMAEHHQSPHQKRVEEYVDAAGSYEARQLCRDLAHPFNLGWLIMTEHARDSLGCYDWQWGPWFMEHCVDWDDVPGLRPNWIDLVRAKSQELDPQPNPIPDPDFVIDGHMFDNPDSDMASDGEFGPFMIFMPRLQDYLPKRYNTRAEAEAAIALLV